jgi:hypothetical protein
MAMAKQATASPNERRRNRVREAKKIPQRSNITAEAVYEYLVAQALFITFDDILRGLEIYEFMAAPLRDTVKEILIGLQMQGLVEIHNFEDLELIFARAKNPVEIVQWKLDKAKKSDTI